MQLIDGAPIFSATDRVDFLTCTCPVSSSPEPRAWQLKIFESLERSRRVVALLSPEYLASKACKEEFGIAWIRGDRIGKDLLFPLYVYTASLPAYMAYWNYLDCREGDPTQLAEASQRLPEVLDRDGPGNTVEAR